VVVGGAAPFRSALRGAALVAAGTEYHPPVRVLVVDDDGETRDLVAAALLRAGHVPRVAATRTQAIDGLHAGPIDVVVLDVMLGEESGLELCRYLRATGVATPVLMLSARGTVQAKVEGLEAGADDYLAKPFALRELNARVSALGRRGPGLKPHVLRSGRVRLHFEHRRAYVDDREIPITAREWAVLGVLAAAQGRVVSFSDLLESAWGEDSENARASLEVIVSRLRRKLSAGGHLLLRTARGLGYALEPRP